MRGDLALSPFWKEFALVLLNILKGPHHLVSTRALFWDHQNTNICVLLQYNRSLYKCRVLIYFFQFRLYHTVVLCAWRFTAALEVAWPRNGESQNGSAKSMLRPPRGHGLIRHFSLKILIVKSVKMQPWWTEGFSSSLLWGPSAGWVTCSKIGKKCTWCNIMTVYFCCDEFENDEFESDKFILRE